MSVGDALNGLPYFDDLDESVKEAVAERSQRLQVPAGQVLIHEGSAADEMYVVVAGHLEVTKSSQGREVVLATLGPGEVVGEMALLDGSPRTATVTTATDAELISVPQRALEDLLRDPGLVRRMIRTVTSRLRDIEDTLRHEERMSALGRMAAQLMHELNNPAAAVSRSSKSLLDVYEKLGNAAMAVTNSGIEMSGRLDQPRTPTRLDPLAKSEAEDEVANWLEKHSVDDPWTLAPPLVEDGWTPAAIDAATSGLSDTQAAVVAEWIALRCLASQMITELQIGAGRISELVRVVKDYSFLDQAPIQVIDITSGISDTLILLKHKLRDIQVVTEFSEDLHQVEASGRDLNQVWTNLIDNAADAMSGGGELRIVTANDGDEVVVSISDTGEGIDPEHLDRLFDPFFTTKEPGKGTGLGLHTVHTIISRAGGTISVDSGGGGTVFEVRLPRATGADTD